MQKIGQAWLVLQLTHSPLALGTVLSLQALPILCGTLFAGVIVDRVFKYRLLLITQMVALVQAGLLAWLTLSGNIQLWQVYVLALLLGLVNAFDNPTRLAFLMELVGRDMVVNAVGLNSALNNGARLVGPAIAGLIIAAWGVGACFGVNAVSFLAVVAALLAMRRSEFQALPDKRPPRMTLLAGMGEGLRFAFSVPDLVTIIIGLAGLGCFGFNFNTIVPLLSDGMNLQADGFGLLMSGVGAGAVLGAIVVAGHGTPSQRRILVAGLAFCAATLTLALTPTFVTAFVQLAVMSFCAIIFQASTNSALQLGGPNELRGRMMSLYTLLTAGASPIGALVTGAITNVFGIRAAIATLGAICTVFMLAAVAYRTRTRSVELAIAA
jgi:MFS family permease